MTQLIVKAKKLNKRNVIPSFLPDPAGIVGVVNENFVFEGEEVNSVPNPALGKWYKDRDGHFYWGGGVEENLLSGTSFTEKLQKADTKFSWWLDNDKYSIPDLWTTGPAPKVTIAILDTGINEHIDFDFSRIDGFNYLDNSAKYKTDAFGHGTHLSGIMIAKGIKSFGIIPSANLFVAKVCNNSGTPSFEAVKNALTDILNQSNGAQGVDIINMSFSLTATNQFEENILEEIKVLLKKIEQNRKSLLISACGDFDLEVDCFPASMEECISVGSISENFRRSSFSTKSSTLDIMAPGEKIISSSGINSTIELEGTSQSAAILSGICAIAVKEFKSKGIANIALLKKALFQTAINNSFDLKEFGHGIINPNSFIKSIKSI